MPASRPKRKTSRKTSHSDIEKRRREKMKLQFDTLRGLLPARTNTSLESAFKLDVLEQTVAHLLQLQQEMKRIDPNNSTIAHLRSGSAVSSPTATSIAPIRPVVSSPDASIRNSALNTLPPVSSMSPPSKPLAGTKVTLPSLHFQLTPPLSPNNPPQAGATGSFQLPPLHSAYAKHQLPVKGEFAATQKVTVTDLLG